MNFHLPLSLRCNWLSVCRGSRTVGLAIATLLLLRSSASACTTNAECDDGVACSQADTCQAGTCVPGGGGDSDGDLICQADDNCPDVANSGQTDLDTDLIGDVCDEDDRPLNIVYGRVKRNSSNNPAKPNGRVFLRGDFLATPPEAPFSAATGFLVRIRDRFAVEGTPGFTGVDQSLTWPAGECDTNARSGRIKCLNGDRTGKIVIAPLPGSSGLLFKWQVEFRKLPISGPFDLPVEATLVTGPGSPPTRTAGIDRVGSIVDCKQINFGLTCRE